MLNIGENILKMRKEKGITQEQLADVLCISAGAVSKWETEASIPDIAMLPKIANFFGVSIDRLFDFTLTDSDTPENILKKVRELAVELDSAPIKYDDIKVVRKCDEAISILTDACIKFPNNYELKAALCSYKHIEAANIEDVDSRKKAEREVLGELYSITKHTTDREITDSCYTTISDIHFKLEEYDKAIETANKYGCKNHLQVSYNQTILSSLIKLGREDEANKHLHNVTYSALMQIYVNLMVSLSLVKDEKKIEKLNYDVINLLKIFSDDSPGPFDYYMSENYKVLGFVHFALEEYDKCVECFEEVYNHMENFKIFSENKEITSDYLKFADTHRFLKNVPYDYKKHLISAFDAMEHMAESSPNDYKRYMALKDREDFKKFIEKITCESGTPSI